MGLEWLKRVMSILAEAGIRADEEYAVGTVPEITEPVAAVGLLGIDCGGGTARIQVRILSPRRLGGWRCQTGAVAAVAALETAGIRCTMSAMSYLSGCDCYSVPIEAELEVRQAEGVWEEGTHWSIMAGAEQVQWVTEFVGEQDQERRFIGASCQTDPVGITPGTGGWVIRMTQQIPQQGIEAEMPEEPFELVVDRGIETQTYAGCCWNAVKRTYSQAGIRVERQGLALSREVNIVG